MFAARHEMSHPKPSSARVGSQLALLAFDLCTERSRRPALVDNRRGFHRWLIALGGRAREAGAGAG
jgi:hypothetical protein